MSNNTETIVYTQNSSTADRGNSIVGNNNKPDMKSSRDGSCPVCGRDHDQDCHWHSDLKTILCYTKGAGGTSSVPCPPDSVPAAIGGNYVFKSMTKDGRAGIYSLKVEQEIKSNRPASKIDYFYQDANGQDVVKVTRTDRGDGSKVFSQTYFDPDAGIWESWINTGTNSKGNIIWKSSFADEGKDRLKSQVPIYNLPTVMAAIAAGKDIWFVEGEGCVDALAEVGIVATTLIAGAGKLKAYNPKAIEALHGARVIPCPDRDQKGLAHMEEVAEALKGKATLLWCYCKPEHSAFWSNLQKDGGLDCKDWLDELGGIEPGAKRDQLYEAVGAAKDWGRKALPTARKDSADEVLQEIPWLAPPVVNYQIGEWSKPRKIAKSELEQLQSRARTYPGTIKISEVGEEEYEVSYFIPKASFDFSVSRRVSSDDGGGLVLLVQWIECGRLIEREAFIKSVDTRMMRDFIAALMRELKQDVSCTLSIESLQALLRNRTTLYHLAGGKVYRLAPVTGQQEDGTWVFEGIQFKDDGTITSENESLWIFNRSLGETEQIPSPKIAQQNPDALKRLVAAFKAVINPELLPLVLFNIGFNTATLQRQEIIKSEHQMPQMTLFGEIGGCKTLASMIGASLTGMHRFVLNKFSESSLYERLKSLSGLVVVLDDPIKPGKNSSERKEQLNGLLWDLFNAFSRKVRGNEQIPRSNIAINTNIALGEGTQAVESRVIKFYYPVLPTIGDDAAESELTEAMHGASGGLGQLLAIKYDKRAVKDIQRSLFALLPHSHKRISGSLALITYFTQKFCDVAEFEFDAFAYCKNHLCPSADECESNKDSLADFLEKLEILKSEGIVGEWNMTQVSKGSKPHLAVYLPAIWGEFEKRFTPNYSRQSLQRLVEGKGGQASTQKFVATKQEWADYERAIAEYNRRDFASIEGVLPPQPSRPSKTASRKCLLIPNHVVTEIIGDDSSDILNNNFSSYSTEAASDIEPEVTQKLPDLVELPIKLPEEVTRETQTEVTIQPKVTRVTQVTQETVPLIKRGAKVEVTATGETGLVVELEDDFATIKLDTPIQSGGLGRKFAGYSLAEIKALPPNSNVFKVGDRVRYNSQFWDVAKIRADKTLDLDHATLQKATSASPAEVELVQQGVAA